MAGYRDGDDTGIVIRVGPIAAGDHGWLTEILTEAIVNTISLFYSSKHHVCGLSTTEEAETSHVYYKPHGITRCRPQLGSAWDDVPKVITFQMGGIQLPWGYQDAGIHLHESRLWLRLRPLQHVSQAIIRRGSFNCSCGTWSADSQANCQDDIKPSIAEMRMLRLLKHSENTAMRPSTPQEGSPVWEPPNLESPIAAQCQHAG